MIVELSPEAALDDSQWVFRGEVLDYDEPWIDILDPDTPESLRRWFGRLSGVTYTATVRVDEVWKGEVTETVQLATVPSQCGISFYELEVGGEFMFFAYRVERGDEVYLGSAGRIVPFDDPWAAAAREVYGPGHPGSGLHPGQIRRIAMTLALALAAALGLVVWWRKSTREPIC